MIYQIMITQTLHGYIEIEADSEENALEMAEKLYSQGEMLPDMEDTDRLTFEPI